MPQVAAAELSDADLIRLVADGEALAAAELLDRYQRPLRAFLTRLTGSRDDGDELAQDAFVRVLRHADRYDPRYAVRTWLFTIARRLAINWVARESRRRTGDLPDSAAAQGPAPGAAVEAAEEQEARRDAIDAALEKLSEPQRTALLLFHQQDCSVSEIADAMGIPPGTVKSHLHRGRQAMQRHLSPIANEIWP